MKERPIIFSGPMVNAILEGRKTQTRRIVKHDITRLAETWEWNNFKANPKMRDWETWGPVQGNILAEIDTGSIVSIPCPYGKPLDRLWVRETWTVDECYDHLRPSKIPRGTSIDYWASDIPFYLGKKRSAMFMPRWASRITLEITDIRIERLRIYQKKTP
jgi:hypothetical protein